MFLIREISFKYGGLTQFSSAKIKGHSMNWYAYTPKPMTHTRIYFLHLTVFDIGPRQDLKGYGHYSKIKGQIKVIP